MCCVGRGTFSQREIVLGSDFDRQISPMRREIAMQTAGSGPDSPSTALCATVVGNREGSSGESRVRGSLPTVAYTAAKTPCAECRGRRNATRWSSGEANGAPATFAPPWPPLIGGPRFIPHG